MNRNQFMQQLCDQLWPAHLDVTLMDQLSIRVTTRDDDVIAIYVIEGVMTDQELRKVINTNSRRTVHTLFLFADDQPDEVTSILRYLWNDQVYRVAIQDNAVIVEVWRYGRSHRDDTIQTVDLSKITSDIVVSELPGMKGFRLIANFRGSLLQRRAHPLQAELDLFGLGTNATLSEVKHVYHRLAQAHHPDTNPNNDTTGMMQQINAAYERLIQYVING